MALCFLLSERFLSRESRFFFGEVHFCTDGETNAGIKLCLLFLWQYTIKGDGIIQDVSNELSDVGNIGSVEDAVKLGISFEDQGRDFYLEFAESATDPAAKDMFLYLAEEEKKHAKYLQSYLEGEDLSIEEDTDMPDFREAFASEFTGEDLGEVGVMLAAMRLERKTEDLYLMLSSVSSDSGQREFFEKLAAVERDHYDLIDGLLASVTGFRMQT
ncbi:Rubrerythrin [Methanococcoides vulcani]|uniref:Rubrerythrin n=1 Tax=Methanococcoides vulcani TaxID=1353158 RepID=A0A1I0BCA2_9EURY|nr:ferritin family protein [Methanococcoides vulcani]SET04450.1 Rubrerythrin [Methanococcoides vulcani]